MPFIPQTPYLTTDGIVEIYNAQEEFEGIVLIQRKNTPLGLALPGGFVDIGESVESAVVREMREEISLDVTISSLFGVYSDPLRDARFHTVSIVYICRAYGVPIGADDAKETKVFHPSEINLDALVFDHGDILRAYLKESSQKYTPLL